MSNGLPDACSTLSRNIDHNWSLKILSIITVRGGCHPHKMLASLRNSSRKGGLGLPSQRSAQLINNLCNVLCVWEIQLDSSARLTMCCNCVSLCSSGMILARGVPWRCSPFLFLLANIVYSDSTYLHSFSFIRQLSNGVYIYTWIIKACMKNVHYYWCYLVLRLLELASAFFRTKNPLLWNMD